jgi:hypothetical protein
MNIIIEIAPEDEERVMEAFGKMLFLNQSIDEDNPVARPATEEEVTEALVNYINSITQMYEQQKHNESFVPLPPVTESGRR